MAYFNVFTIVIGYVCLKPISQNHCGDVVEVCFICRYLFKVESSVPHYVRETELASSNDCIGSCQSNYHTIATDEVP